MQAPLSFLIRIFPLFFFLNTGCVSTTISGGLEDNVGTGPNSTFCLCRMDDEKVGLQISARLENCTELKAVGDDFRWYLKLKCNQCGDQTYEFVYVDLLESQPLKGGRGSASLVIKCKFCSNENSLNLLKESLDSYTYDDCPKYKTIVVFECRGVQPIFFDPRVGWEVKGLESGTKFSDVDLSQDWADYDEKAKDTVGVYELKYQFIRM
ncbi:hypothetical protein HELRODRAFT_173258 [Helobdella robusta]|uniref:CXXC motif containing zinc binding protein n=1 Tax=Helobdella robusta TaxID=6412 RepID=T1F6M0_HELRO|nr:hypothetical protein HELRODRAFT_173258 [Helobdella robusta]ESO03557.1 hypothetical protein HELRODRAFT_173258 [Helobdella robusta]